MKSNTTKLLASATLAMAFAASAVTAQTAEPTAAIEMAIDETVIVGNTLYKDQVNALKTPTLIIDVPQSLSITTADDISIRGFNSIGDIVDYTPGVSVSQGEGHRDAVVFRGVRSTADFFVDGVRDDVQYYRPLYNVDQVEILRGPNALLFGRGGAGGVLNRVTKKGVIGEDFNGYQLSIDTFGATEAQIDSNVAINEDTAFRINAYYNTFENHRDFSDGEGYGVNPTVKFQLSDKTTLDVSYEYIDYDRSIDRGIPTANGKPVDALNDIVFGDSDLNKSELEAHTLRAMFQHEFSDTLKGVFTASYSNHEKMYQNLYASDYNPAGDIVELDGYVDTTDRDSVVFSGNLVSEFETGDISHTFIFGAEYIHTESDNDRYTDNWTAAKTFAARGSLTKGGIGIDSNGDATSVKFDTLNDDTHSEVDVYSLYLQDEIELSEALTLVLGARFDSFDIDVSGEEKGNNLSGSQKDEEFTPRAGIIYKPQENISVYASYSETFVPQSGEQFANLGDEGLDPDEFTNLEIGIKWDFAKGYSLTAAAFKIDQDIVQDDGVGGSETLSNEITGFEAQFNGQITDKWSLTAGYSFLDGETDSDDRPRELPENMLSVWNHYQVTEKLGLGLGAVYQDDSKIKDSATSPELPDFFRVDAAAYYQISKNLRLQVNIENLLDEEYYPSSHSTHQATVGAPIHARFSITGRF
jgi:catecholate siderophore receptor